MRRTNAKRLAAVGFAAPLAEEMERQLLAGVGHYPRLLELGMPPTLAQGVSAYFSGRHIPNNEFAELGMNGPQIVELTRGEPLDADTLNGQPGSYYTDAANLTGTLAVAHGGTGATTPAGAQAALGLGTMATQNANAVAITGGTAALSSLTVPAIDGGLSPLQFTTNGLLALRLDSNQNTTVSNNLTVSGSGLVAGVFSTASTARFCDTVGSAGTVEIGLNRTADGTAVLNFHSALGPSAFSFRINRFAGVDGITRLEHTGAGTLDIYSGGTGSVRTLVGGVQRMTVSSADITFVDPGGATQRVGYRGIPPVVQSAAYTLALTDVGKCIDITAGGVTVPPTSSVAFGNGDTVDVFNNSATAQTVAQGAGVTIRLSGTATTGDRTLAPWTWARLRKLPTNVWVISGQGVT
jgi:hypothetical protein